MEGQNKMHINYSYMIFVTPYGKAYGCFAVQKIQDHSYKISASFVHPNDARNWKKSISRNIAAGRLEKPGKFVEITLDGELSDMFKTYYVKLFKDYRNELGIPNWAMKCYDIEAYMLSLSADNIPYLDMVREMDLSEEYFAEMYNYCNNAW